MTRRFYCPIIIFVLTLLLSTSCSTKKNTGASRAYHSMCAKYNIAFNAKNAYSDGIKTINKTENDDFSQRIDMFPISNKSNQSVAVSDMDRSIEKCRKAIKNHSITKRPKKNLKKWKKPSYQYFFNQEEYVQEVKDAWILLGKSELHKGDFMGAASTFSYIQKHYPSDKYIVCEARIWQARAYAEMGWIYEAQEVFDKINENDVSRRLTKDYAQTKAFILLAENNTDEAIGFLQMSADKEKNRYLSSRFNYLLGQLYLDKNQLSKAEECFKTAKKQSQNYLMEFNANLMLMRNSADWKKSVKKLERMAKNSNNKNYKDRIYTFMGDIYIAHKDTVKAIDAYRKAVDESVTGGVDKATALLTLGDIYYAKRQYIEAHPCYQEASTIISNTHPDYRRASMLGETLGNLAQNFNTVQLQDSLQHLSTLSEEEQLKVVNKIIEQVKKDEEEAARLAEENKSKGFVESERLDMGANIGGNADWYFYNPRLKSSGASQFRRIWGNRSLEDNWRRTNKVASTMSSAENGFDGEETDEEAEDGKEVVPPHHKPEYYLANIPKTKEQIALSNSMTADALLNMAVIYDEKLADYPMAIDTYDSFLERFGQDSRSLDALYSSYRIDKKMGNDSEADVCRRKIIEQYPDSKYAAILSDADYFEKMQQMLHNQDSLYAATYAAYGKGDYSAVKRNYNYMQQTYPLSDLMPKFAFLNSLAIGKATPGEPFREALVQLIADYPQSDVTPMCKDILALMGQGMEAQKSMTNTSIADRRAENAEFATDSIGKQLEFIADTKTSHLLLIIPRQADEAQLNALLFDIAAFNFTKFMIKDYDLAKRNYGLGESVVISALESLDEALWYESMLLAEPSLEGKITLDKVDRIIISADNLDVITKGKSWDEYKEFAKNIKLDKK